MRIAISLILILFFNNLFSQVGKDIIKTVEYYDDNSKRREIIYDNDMNVIKEIYFDKDPYYDKVYTYAIIEYLKPNQLKLVQKFNDKNELTLSVDFLSGTYNNYEKNIFLQFKDDYVFNGLQRGKNIVVNYKDGKRDGRLLQTDSAVDGNKIVSEKMVDTRYLRFNILKYYNQPYTVSTFKLFNGIEFQFKDDYLDGVQRGFYPNSDTKFEATYDNLKLISYNSYTSSKSLISKIKTDNGFTKNRQIINGAVVEDSSFRLYYLKRFMNTGKIALANFSKSIFKYPNYPNFVINSKKFKPDIKKSFDKNKSRFNSNWDISEPDNNFYWIFGIPIFTIIGFDLDISEDRIICPIEFGEYRSNDNTPEISTIKIYKYLIANYIEKFDHIYSPLTNIPESSLINSQDNTYNEDFYEDTLVKSYLFKILQIDKNIYNKALEYKNEITKKQITDLLTGSKWITKGSDREVSIWVFEKDGVLTRYFTNDLKKREGVQIIQGKWIITDSGIDIESYDKMKYNFYPWNSIYINYSNINELFFGEKRYLIKYTEK